MKPIHLIPGRRVTTRAEFEHERQKKCMANGLRYKRSTKLFVKASY